MWSLLIVALLALGVLATIGLESSTGAVPARPGVGGAIKPPLPKPVIIDRGPETVVVQDGADEVIYSDSSYADAIYVSCDLAQASGAVGKMSQRSREVCAYYGLLWPYVS